MVSFAFLKKCSCSISSKEKKNTTLSLTVKATRNYYTRLLWPLETINSGHRMFRNTLLPDIEVVPIFLELFHNEENNNLNINYILSTELGRFY